MSHRLNGTAPHFILRWLTYKSQQHPFHILPPSPFPPLVGLTVVIFLIPLTAYLHNLTLFGCSLGRLSAYLFALLLLVALAWFTAIVQESAFGFHTRKVQEGLRFGMLLFILSEVMLFFAFFWGFFHVSLSPSIAIGDMWPPVDTQPLSVWSLPLVNTLLLLSSGLTITVAHALLVQRREFSFFWNLFLTILLGVVFLLCQSYEYQYGVLFSFRENIYGSIFFLTTGFHGMHVTIGTLFLLYCIIRYISSNTVLFSGIDNSRCRYLMLSPSAHFGFEAAAWYWHFVDVVWLFLFLSVYWWGGASADVTGGAACALAGLSGKASKVFRRRTLSIRVAFPAASRLFASILANLAALFTIWWLGEGKVAPFQMGGAVGGLTLVTLLLLLLLRWRASPETISLTLTFPNKKEGEHLSQLARFTDRSAGASLQLGEDIRGAITEARRAVPPCPQLITPPPFGEVAKILEVLSASPTLLPKPGCEEAHQCARRLSQALLVSPALPEEELLLLTEQLRLALNALTSDAAIIAALQRELAAAERTPSISEFRENSVALSVVVALLAYACLDPVTATAVTAGFILGGGAAAVLTPPKEAPALPPEPPTPPVELPVVVVEEAPVLSSASAEGAATFLPFLLQLMGGSLLALLLLLGWVWLLTAPIRLTSSLGRVRPAAPFSRSREVCEEIRSRLRALLAWGRQHARAALHRFGAALSWLRGEGLRMALAWCEGRYRAAKRHLDSALSWGRERCRRGLSYLRTALTWCGARCWGASAASVPPSSDGGSDAASASTASLPPSHGGEGSAAASLRK